MYESLISFLYRTLFGSKTGNAPTEAETMKFIAEFTDRVTVWGSDGVLKAFSDFRREAVNATSGNAGGKSVLFAYEDLLYAVRRDLGHGNRGLKRGDILALFVNDIEEHLKKNA